MASPQAVRAGQAYVEWTIRDLTDKQLRKIESRVRQAGNRMREAARAFAITAVPAFATAKSIQAYGELDESVRLAAAATGQAEKSYGSLMRTSLELGRSTVFTADQIGSLEVVLARAGKSAGEISGGLARDVQTLGRATGTELNMAGQIMVDTMNAAGLESKETGRAIDVMTNAVNNATMDLEDFNEAFKLVGAAGRTLELDIEHVSAAISFLANRGIKGSIAGTSLRRAFINMSKEDTQKKMADLGVSVKDAEGNFRGLVDILGDLDTALKGEGAIDKMRQFNEIFGDRAFVAIQQLAEGNAEGLRKMTARMFEANTAARNAAFANRSIGAELKLLWSAIKGVVLTVGAAMAPIVRIFGPIAVFFLKSISDILEVFWPLATVIGVTTFALVTLTGVVLAVAAAEWAWAAAQHSVIAGMVMQRAGILAMMGTKLIIWIAAAVAQTWAWVVASGALTAVTGALATAWAVFMSMPPMAAIAVIIGVVAVAVWGLIKAVKALGGVFSWLFSVIMLPLRLIGNIFKGIGRLLGFGGAKKDELADDVVRLMDKKAAKGDKFSTRDQRALDRKQLELTTRNQKEEKERHRRKDVLESFGIVESKQAAARGGVIMDMFKGRAFGSRSGGEAAAQYLGGKDLGKDVLELWRSMRDNVEKLLGKDPVEFVEA